MEELVRTRFHNFGYQLQLSSGIVERAITNKEQIRQFLTALYGGHGPHGERGFDTVHGVKFENLPKLGASPLLSQQVSSRRENLEISDPTDIA